MLTAQRLTDWTRALGSRKVLSVYIDGRPEHAGDGISWQRRLDASIAELRDELADRPEHERRDFERSVALLATRLPSGQQLESPGWAGFVLPDEVWYAGAVPVRVTNVAAWRDGACAAPYVRALKEHRPVFVGVADSRTASIYQYAEGQLLDVGTLHSHAQVRTSDHMGSPPKQGFHAGTRGTAGTDAAQRALRNGRDRLIRQLARRLATLSQPNGWIVLGGTPTAAQRTYEALPKRSQARAQVAPALSISATGEQIAAAAALGGSTLRRASDDRAIEELLNGSRSTARVAPDEVSTRLALRRGAVRRLYVSRRSSRRGLTTRRRWCGRRCLAGPTSKSWRGKRRCASMAKPMALRPRSDTPRRHRGRREAPGLPCRALPYPWSGKLRRKIGSCPHDG